MSAEAVQTFRKAERVRLKEHPGFDERALEKMITSDPGMLGLGELSLIEAERRQGPGRLDLLLQDSDDGRYTVELQLGAADADHIVRCVEYWDHERRRYPAYDHTAVLVAEDVTTRFLNVMALFAGSIPLIVLQLTAFRAGGEVWLDFVRILDRMELRRDDVAESPPADRAYWIGRSSPELIELCEIMLGIVNERAQPKRSLNYNKQFIGLHDGMRSGNFIRFVPHRHVVNLRARVGDPETWQARFEAMGIASRVKASGRLKVSLSSHEFESNRALVTELLHRAADESEA